VAVGITIMYLLAVVSFTFGYIVKWKELSDEGERILDRAKRIVDMEDTPMKHRAAEELLREILSSESMK
jgi:hypothetical protein